MDISSLGGKYFQFFAGQVNY